jgi:ubiquinone/menaquinone biosynthesis C-methylase UbiE
MTGHGAASGAVASGFDQAAGDYDTTGTEFFAQVGRRLVTLAGITPGARVLDVGCGKGAATSPAAQAAGPTGQVTGIDTSAAMLEQAATAASRDRLENVTLLQADAEDPPFPGGTADVLLAANVIELLARPDRTARRWLTLLAPGGTLALTWGITQDPAWVPVMAALDAVVPEPVPGFEAFFRRPPFDTRDGLADMLSGCGYTETVTHAEPVTTVYEDPQQWWQACLGQAQWVVSWRHIPPRDLQTARSEAFRLLDDLRGPGGRLTRTLGFGYTLARRPAQTQEDHRLPPVAGRAWMTSGEVNRARAAARERQVPQCNQRVPQRRGSAAPSICWRWR